MNTKTMKKGGGRRMNKLTLITLVCAVVAFVSSPAFAIDFGGYEGPMNFKFVGFSQSGDETFYSMCGWE